MRRIPWIAVVALAGLQAQTAFALDPLPEGDVGIAVGYPGDAGIDGDPAVIFADDFEGYGDASELPTRWDAAFYQPDQIFIATDAENVYGGVGQSVEMNVPQQPEELSNSIDKAVSPERDSLFLRYYSKFEGPYDIVGSSHNGSMIASHYFDNGNATPGVPANGTNKWLANLENWRGEAEMQSPGLLNIYIYHPEQRSDYGDHFWPDGTITPYDPDPPVDYFGPDFVPRDIIYPSLDEWHCYEFMVVANTPGERDGRIAMWFDGVLAGDFPNLRLRDVPELTIDRFGLSFHIGSNPGAPQRKWYDNVVAASEYIGPVYEGGSVDDTGPGTDGGDADGSSGGGDDASGTMTGGGSATGGMTDGGSTGVGSTAASVGDSGGSDGGGENDDEASGCGCGTAGPRGAGFGLGLVLLARPRRRR